MSILLPQQGSASHCSLFSLLWRLWCHLSRRRQLQFGAVLFLMLISTFAEMVSLGAVIPFLGVLIAPDKILSHSVAVSAAEMLGITSSAELLLPFTIVFAIAALVAGCIRAMLLWSNTRLAYVSASDISFEVYRRTLYQPYQIHLSRNSNVVISGLEYKVGFAIGVLLQSLTLVSSLLLLIALLTVLLVINAAVAAIAAIGFGAFYALTSWMFRRKLGSNAERIARESTQVTKAVQEGLGGIRDVLLDGTQSFYCDIYRRADYPLRLAMGNNVFIAGSPVSSWKP